MDTKFISSHVYKVLQNIDSPLTLSSEDMFLQTCITGWFLQEVLQYFPN